jgi:hypothetical protein
MSDDNIPTTVLQVIVDQVDGDLHLLGVGAGHEDSSWRYDALARDLIKWAPDWVLTHEELKSMGAADALDLISKALSRVYNSEKYQNRGEVGELLLHIILRSFRASNRAISRIYFKDAPNDTVKGFDAVHVVENAGELELWLGESKFYVDPAIAASAVIAELKEHLATPYLRNEFAAISDKLEVDWKYTEQLRALLRKEVSLDEVFARVVVPVFITFDDDVTAKHSTSSEEYIDEVKAMFQAKLTYFAGRISDAALPREVRVHLILLPMATKKKLLDSFDGRLKGWQTATS